MRGTMRRTPGQNTEPISGYDVPVIESTGRGVDMGELYAAAKGRGIKERMRILIDLDAAKASSIGEFSRLLDLHGIGLAMRGGGATFTDRTTGRKFRGCPGPSASGRSTYPSACCAATAAHGICLYQKHLLAWSWIGRIGTLRASLRPCWLKRSGVQNSDSNHS